MLDGNSKTTDRRRAVTDDLVKRLRATWAWSHDRPVNPDGAEAADRIEQLEGTMLLVLSMLSDDHPAKKNIRAALREKKDGN